jgi:hypothetical protein
VIRRCALTVVALGALIPGAMAQEPKPLLAILGEGNTVLACWEDQRLIAPLDCIGRDVIAATSTKVGLRGQILKKNRSQLEAAVSSRGDWLASSVELHTPPLSLPELLKAWMEEQEDVPPDSEDAFAVFAPSSLKSVPLGLDPPKTEPAFDRKKALAEVQAVLKDAYQDGEPGDVLWVDVDRDGRIDAVTLAFDDGGEPACMDLVVIPFADDGTVSERDALIERLKKAKCGAGEFFQFVEQITYKVVPWPVTPSGFAIKLDGCAAGCDGFQSFIMPLQALKDSPTVAADYSGVWWAND